MFCFAGKNAIRPHTPWIRAAGMLFTLVVVELAFGQAPPPKVDVEARKVLFNAYRFHERLENFAVEVESDAPFAFLGDDVDGDEESSKESDTRWLVVSRPGRIYVGGTRSSDPMVQCDAKKLIAHLPSRSEHLLQDAPVDLSVIMQTEAFFVMGPAALLLQFLEDDLGEYVSTLQSMKLLDDEAIESVECHRIELTKQNGSTLTLWVQKGEQPVFRRLRHGGQIEMGDQVFQLPEQTLTMRKWATDAKLSDAIFAIRVPEESKLVDSFAEEQYVHPSLSPPKTLGQPAPELTLVPLDGGQATLKELRGENVAVLWLWTPWQPGVNQELLDFNAAAAHFKDKRVVFAAINYSDDADHAKRFVDEADVDVPVFLDPDATASKSLSDTMPRIVVIDAEGVVQVIDVLPNSKEKLIATIDMVLAKQPLAAQTLQRANELLSAGKPLPAAPDAYTQKDVTRLQVAYNEATLVGAYQSVGWRSAKWNEGAIAFLSEMAKRFSSAEDRLPEDQLTAMGKSVVEGGCQDPLVIYAYAAVLQSTAEDDQGQLRRVESLLQKSYNGLRRRGYPPTRCFAAAERLLKFAIKKNQPFKKNKFRDACFEHALAMLTQFDDDDPNVLFVYDSLVEFGESLEENHWELLCEKA
ncbi:MAG: redoxin family protein, partial [Planctomycetota bacterium]